MERDIEDYLGWLRDKRGKAAQTLSTYRRMLRRFAAAHSGRDLRLLDDEALQHYLSNHLGSGNRSPATLSQHRTVLRGFYEWLYRQRILCNGAKFFALFGRNLCTSSSAARRFYLR